MPDLRSIHRQKLKTILSSISFEGTLVAVESYYTREFNQYPTIFIGSGNAELELLDTATYDVNRKYTLNVVLAILDDTQTSVRTLEASMDKLESLILETLRKQSTRDSVAVNDAQNWLDITVETVSAPFNGAEISLNDNEIVKTFSINIRDLENYYV